MGVGIHEGIGAVCAVAVASFAWPLFDPSRAWDFVETWDDKENFLDNNLYHGLSWVHLHAMFTLTIINVWEPFGWLLKAIVYATAGLNSRAYRIATLLLHLGAAWGLARTAALVLAIVHCSDHLAQSSPRGTHQFDPAPLTPAHHLPGSILSALIVFAVHPIHVEVVGWPSAQPYALAAMFSVVSLYFHCRRVYKQLNERLRSPSPRATRGAAPETENAPSDWERLVGIISPPLNDQETQLSAGFFVAAVMSKSVCILLPVATVLVDSLVLIPVGQTLYARTGYFPTHAQCLRFAIQYVRGRLLIGVAAVGLVVMTLAANEEGAHEFADMITLTVMERIIKAASTPAWMVRHLLWPASLRPHYALHDGELDLSTNPEYLLLVISFPLFVYWLAVRQSKFRVPSLLAVAYVCTMMLPTCGIIQHGIVTKSMDRYAYFPVMVFVPIGGHYLTQWLGLQQPSRDGDEHALSSVHSVSSASRDQLHKGSTTQRDEQQPPRGAKRPHGLLGNHAAHARVMYAVVLATMVTVSNHQLSTWENNDRFLGASLRLDPSDSRLLDNAFQYKLRSKEGCGEGLVHCKSLINLAYHFAPVKTLKAKVFRYMLVFLLGRPDISCEGYKLLLAEYPDSGLLLNNLSTCRFQEGRQAEGRELMRRAQSATFYSKREQMLIAENSVRIEEWMAKTAKAKGQQVPFEVKLVW